MNDFIAKPLEPAAPPAAVPGVEVVVARLEAMQGVRVARGLELFGGDAARYLDLLRRLVVFHSGDMTRLVESLDAGEHETAVRLAHSLKGATAMLGIDHLSAVAAGLEAALGSSSREPVDREALLAAMAAVNAAFAELTAALNH